jgi:transcriptional regulator with XRE-family HTH domain
MTFGDYIRQERNNRNWTQDELARRSGVKRPVINLYESNEVKRPNPNNLFKIANAFSIDVRVLNVLAGYEQDQELPIVTPPDKLVSEINQILGRMIPVFDSVPGKHIVNYIKLHAGNEAPPNLNAYRVPGLVLEPEISQNDTIVTDDSIQDYRNGDLVICTLEDKPEIKRVKRSNEEIFLVNDKSYELGKSPIKVHGVVVGVIKHYRK